MLLFLPVLILAGDQIKGLGPDPAIALANFHLAFNLATSLLFVTFINPFTRLVEKLVGEGQMDFERLAIRNNFV